MLICGDADHKECFADASRGSAERNKVPDAAANQRRGIR